MRNSSGTNSNAPGSPFWRPPLWKWGVVLLFLVCAVLLVFWKPSARPPRVELLPFSNSPPPWNGSVPYVVISPVNLASSHAQFKSSILLIEPTVRHDAPTDEFLVDLQSGSFILRQTDFFIADVMPLSLTRTYHVWDINSRAFGVGANHPFDVCPTGTRNPYTYMDLNLEDGRQMYFRRISKGTGYADAVFRHDETSSEFYGAQIAWNGNGWTLQFLDGRQFIFPEAYNAKNFAQGAAFEIRDAARNRSELKRDSRRNLQELISPSGHTITFRYDQADRIIEASDDEGKVREYSYNSSGHLDTVSNAVGVLYYFKYESILHAEGYDPYLMTQVIDGKGTVLLQNFYADGSRVSEQKLANGDVYRYDYRFVKGHIAETIVDTPTGERKFFFRDGILTGER
jgi:YD repeat-containing protein